MKFTERLHKIPLSLDSKHARESERAFCLTPLHDDSARGRFNFAFVFEHFRTAAAHTPAQSTGDLPMGFLFRAAFWLAIAAVILPPEARLGGDEQVELRDIDLESELHDAAYAAWTFSTHVFSACESNPELCGAANKLWDTTTATVVSLAADMREPSEKPAEIRSRDAEPKPKPAQKIQARVE